MKYVRYHADDDHSVIPERFGAYITKGRIINIRERYREDEGLHRHEFLHVKRAIRSFFIYWLRYNWCKAFRYRAEIECYREQLRYPPAAGNAAYAWKYAGFVATKYGLDVDYREAYEDILK